MPERRTDALATGARPRAPVASDARIGTGKIVARACQGVDSSYVSRMVNLTTLAPGIVAAILDETLPPDLTLFALAVDPPALWEEQRLRIGLPLCR
jgi:hypothetical protein